MNLRTINLVCGTPLGVPLLTATWPNLSHMSHQLGKQLFKERSRLAAPPADCAPALWPVGNSVMGYSRVACATEDMGGASRWEGSVRFDLPDGM